MIAGYGMVQWAGPFLSFIFTPIITRLVSPGDYGIADYVTTIASAVGMLALFAQPQALAAHFNDRPADDWKRSLTGSALSLTLAIGLPLSLALIALAPQLSRSAFGGLDQARLFQIVGAAAGFSLAGTVLSAASQAALRVRWGMALSVATILGTVGGNIVYIIALRLGATGIVLTQSTTGVVVCLTALIVARRLIGAPSRATLKLLARSGAILLPTMLSGWVLMVADRLFLVQHVSTEQLGYYAIANKITGLLHVAMTPIYSAWVALALSIQHEPDAKQRYAIMSRYIIMAVLSAALGLGLFAIEILLVMTRPAYLPAAPYVGVLAYAQVFTAFGQVLYISAVAGKSLSAVSGTVMLGAALNIVLNFVLIPPLGLWGATLATVAGYGVPQLSLYFIVQRRYPVDYPARRWLALLAIQFVLLAIGLALPPLPVILRLVIKAGLFAILLAAGVLLGFITRFELEQVQLFVRHRLRLARAPR
jgi:O-antigen/teichoic acid export membrane protein